MNKYLWTIGPVIAGSLGWLLSEDWRLGLALVIATGVTNYFTYARRNRYYLRRSMLEF